MLTLRAKLFATCLFIFGLVKLPCSLTGELVGSLDPVLTPAAASATATLPPFTPPTATLPPQGSTHTPVLTQLPESTLPPPIPIPTSLPATLEPTATTVLGDTDLSGVIFFDYDGDGLHGDGEPGLANLWVCIYPAEGDRCAPSDENGQYLLSGLPAGLQEVFVVNFTNDPAESFRYINLFSGWREIPGHYVAEHWVERQQLPVTEMQRIDTPMMVDLQPGATLDIALTQGFLTDIFACGVRQRVETYQAYDLDPREGHVRNYQESESRTVNGGTTVLNGDNHFALDWGNTNQYLVGTPLYAPASGTVIFAGIDRTPIGDCLVVHMVHPDSGTSSGVLHLEKVLVKDQQKVLRGQLLGTLGQSCATWPHVHFFLRSSSVPVVGQWEGIDPYRDTAAPDSVSYWTKDNAPQCPTFIQ